MDIVFLNNSKSLRGLSIKNYSSNPGIGGTEYVTLKIIYELNKLSEKLKIRFATEQKVISKEIKIITRKEKIENSILVLPISQINYLNTLNIKNCRIILWSHHPHDSINHLKHKYKEVISLGEYQYASNKNISNKSFIIQNPYPKPIPKKELLRANFSTPKNFVFLGAIGPAKGLHLVLENWPKIRRKFKNSNLRVIGGNLYREKEKSGINLLNFSISYEKVIERKLNKMSIEDKDSISFLGLISESEKDKVLKDSDIALLNPTGKSEAAPASPLECYCYGIPVIAGGDFGAFDNMKKFPELDLKINKLDTIIDFLIDEKNYKLIKKRTYEFALESYKKNNSIYSAWIKLFNNNLEKPNIKLPSVIYKKIKFREIYYRFIKYPFKKLRRF